MTDAAAAPGLTDVWNLLVAVVGRLPVQYQVLIVLGALVALIMIIDGVRANFVRKKPEALHIVRAPHSFTPPVRRLAALPKKSAPSQAFKVKRVRKLSPYKAPRPSITRATLNHIPFDEPPVSQVYQPSAAKSLREQIGTPL